MKLKYLVALCLCICVTGCAHSSKEVVKESKLYSYMDKLEADTTAEKQNNPEAAYQVVDGTVYLMASGSVYCIQPETKEVEKIIGDAISFLVVDKKIYYCTSYGLSNSLRVCDLDGKNDSYLCKNVDVCTVGKDDNTLLLSGHVEQWSIGEYDLKNKKFTDLKIDSNSSAHFTCFAENKVIYGDEYCISSVDVTTGKEVEVWDLYNKIEAYAKVTCLYVHNNKIYAGIKALEKKDNSVTGLWCMNIDGSEREQISNKAAYNICFVGDECVVLK